MNIVLTWLYNIMKWRTRKIDSAHHTHEHFLQRAFVLYEPQNFTEIKTSKSDCKPFDLKEVSSPTKRCVVSF